MLSVLKNTCNELLKKLGRKFGNYSKYETQYKKARTWLI